MYKMKGLILVTFVALFVLATTNVSAVTYYYNTGTNYNYRDYGYHSYDYLYSLPYWTSGYTYTYKYRCYNCDDDNNDVFDDYWEQRLQLKLENLEEDLYERRATFDNDLWYSRESRERILFGEDQRLIHEDIEFRQEISFSSDDHIQDILDREQDRDIEWLRALCRYTDDC